MKNVNRLFLFFLSGVLALSAAHVTAQSLPEFGSAVEFDSTGPQPTLAKLKNKAVLIIFFKSRFGLSSSFGNDFFADFQKTHGNNRGLALIAIKTDGGSVSSAKDYLKAIGANLDLWVVGCDTEATYYKQVADDDDFWGYVLAGSDGNIIRKGSVLSYFVGGTSKRFVLADPKLVSDCGELKTVLPADTQYDPSMTGLVRMAELGEAERALMLCNAALNKPKERQAAAALKADLQPLIEKRLVERAAVLSDTSKPSPARYDALLELTQIAKELKTTLPSATKIAPLLSKARQEPAMQKEARAETAYLSTLARLKKASARDKPRLVKELESIAQKNPDTKFGQLAGDSAKQLGDSVSVGAK